MKEELINFVDYPSFFLYIECLYLIYILHRKSMRKSLYFLIIFVLFTSNFSTIYSKVNLKGLPSYDLLSVDSLFLDVTGTREITSLNKGWKVYVDGDSENATSTSVPASFEGISELIFERSITLSKDDIENHQVQIKFIGLSYSAEVLLNDLIIYKHPGGLHPFSVTIPSDLVKPGNPNKLVVKVTHNLDDVNTIPLIHGYLYPVNFGGILRDVYLETTPLLSIDDAAVDYELESNYTKASVNVGINIKNSLPSSLRKKFSDTRYTLQTVVRLNGTTAYSFSHELSGIVKKDLSQSNLKLELPNVSLWTPDEPVNYIFEFNLFQNDSLIDRTRELVNFYSLGKSDSSFTLNGNPVSLKGTTYIKSTEENGRLVTYDELKSDLRLIKETGFNSVRFAQQTPHPYALQVCSELGLFAFVELPLTSIPGEIIVDQDFQTRAEGQLNFLLNEAQRYNAVAAIGLGSGFLPDSPEQLNFIRNLASLAKEKTHKLIFASFLGIPERKIDGVDLYGIELFSKNPVEDTQLLNAMTNFGTENLFISAATYPSYKGNTNGYLNKNSYEAQAKYFRDIISFSKENKLPAFYLNTFFNYKGKFKSFYTGYSSDGYYHIGLLRDKNDINSIAYKTVKAELLDSDKLTIPIGSTTNESPIFFIIIGLALSIFMALLINSKRKFREDAGRALMRPYNFFADIRDMRILSGIQTILLMIVLSGSIGLVFINVLYYLRSNILLEKFLLAFSSQNMVNSVLFVSWHPIEGFFILWAFVILLFLMVSLIVKFFTVFIKNKVFFSSIFYTVVWSLLPFSLLLPLELVLYRILLANVINLYVFIFLGLFIVWILQRLLKGVYVVFEVRSSAVYLYSFLFFIVVAGIILLIYHLQFSTIYYIMQAFRDYSYI